MSCRLEVIENWVSLARRHGYRVSSMASAVNVSTRTMETFFVTNFRRNPRAWLEDLKWTDAHALLRQGASMKSIAYELGYAHPRNFSRGFKNRFGSSPGTLRKPCPTTSQNETPSRLRPWRD